MSSKIEKKIAEIKAVNIRNPEEAPNVRGNPDVEVTVSQMGRVIERYQFEFVRPPENEEFPRYRYGPFASSEDANYAKYRNEAAFRAAEALAEHTETPVETLIHPSDELKRREKRLTE